MQIARPNIVYFKYQLRIMLMANNAFYMTGMRKRL